MVVCVSGLVVQRFRHTQVHTKRNAYVFSGEEEDSFLLFEHHMFILVGTEQVKQRNEEQ